MEVKCLFCKNHFDLEPKVNRACPYCDSYYQYMEERETFYLYYGYPHKSYAAQFESMPLRLPKNG